MRYRDSDVAVVVTMPFKRDPLKPLTDEEEWEIALLGYEIAELYRELGGDVCGCGKIYELCTACQK